MGWETRRVTRPISFMSNPLPSSTLCRSEEHTSELQSLVNLVCRLLLEKKKEKKITQFCRKLAASGTLNDIREEYTDPKTKCTNDEF